MIIFFYLNNLPHEFCQPWKLHTKAILENNRSIVIAKVSSPGCFTYREAVALKSVSTPTEIKRKPV